MNFLGIGSTELLVAAVLALLVLGPQRLVKFARSAGKTVRRMQNMTSELTKSITETIPEDEEPPDKDKKKPRLQKIADEIKQALTLGDDKPAVSDSEGPDGEEAAPATDTLAKSGQQIGQTLQKITDEINEALNPKEPTPEGQEGTNE